MPLTGFPAGETDNLIKILMKIYLMSFSESIIIDGTYS